MRTLSTALCSLFATVLISAVPAHVNAQSSQGGLRSRRQVRVADPGLPIAGERRPRRQDRPRSRQVQKVAIDYLDLRAEEVVAGGKNDRAGKRDRDLDFLTGKGRPKR